MTEITFDFIVSECLCAIFKNDLLSKDFYLKGGQAIRFGEKIDMRMSIDMDFSVQGHLTENYLQVLEDVLKEQFLESKLAPFDFKYERRPRTNKIGFPDWWRGYAISFKLISIEKKDLGIEEKRRYALRPLDAQGSTLLSIDISPGEYCGSYDTYEIKGVLAKKYSTALIIIEKLRALCQQHPDYKFTSHKKRARDFFDISILLDKPSSKKEVQFLFDECQKHFKAVFDAKEVPIDLIHKIFDDDFLNNQRLGWEETKATISSDVQNFDIYIERVKGFVSKLKLPH